MRWRALVAGLAGQAMAGAGPSGGRRPVLRSVPTAGAGSPARDAGDGGDAGDAGGSAPAVVPRPKLSAAQRRRAWAELLRLPAVFTVPGDALAGAAAVGARPSPRTLLAIGSSLCLYEAGMALNDWADREEDAAERPHRPLPSGRIRPAAALAAAGVLTAAGLALAARAGRPALAVAVPLAATVWAYDLALKGTPAGPVAMAGTRSLDLLLGAAATTGRTRAALPSAALLGTHTLAVTAVSRQETRGGSPLAPLAALAATALLTHLTTRLPAAPGEAATRGVPGTTGEGGGAEPVPRRADAAPTVTGAPPPTSTGRRSTPGSLPPTATLRAALGALYAATAARPYFHAVLNPSPPLTQRAVGGGIRATIPLQAALAARSGAPLTALAVAALGPLAARFAKKVSVT
ncbi:SCO3242 family prenyltransferase [Streptomyces sp. NPDC088387]|uniref:SCO3242 family prenyltransferase n=1 Tax=Streptomyces sp. NPDC088387 TaxID=3365859 RepID=UPI00381709C2